MYKPKEIDLETKLCPIIPDYHPAIGKPDAFLKMPQPNGDKEDLGLTQLDERAVYWLKKEGQIDH